MSSTLVTVTQTVSAVASATATAAAKPICYNRWFHPQSCIWNKVEMGFAFTGLALLILSGILYTLAACADCFPCGKREKKKEAVIRDEEAMLERNSEDKFRPSSEFTKGSNPSQETFIPPARPSEAHQDPFADPYTEQTSSYNPHYVSSSSSYSTSYPSRSDPGHTTPGWTAPSADVTEQHHLMPQPIRTGNDRPGFRESMDY